MCNHYYITHEDESRGLINNIQQRDNMRSVVTLPKRFVEGKDKKNVEHFAQNGLPTNFEIIEEYIYQLGRAGLLENEEETTVNAMRFYRIGSKEQAMAYQHIEATGVGKVWEVTAQIGRDLYVMGCHY